MAKLHGRSGMYENVDIPFDGRIVIGRDPAVSQLILNGSDISRKHCEITYDPSGDRYLVEDFSSNGVFRMDGTRIPASPQKVSFMPGDGIRIGRGNEVFVFGREKAQQQKVSPAAAGNTFKRSEAGHGINGSLISYLYDISIIEERKMMIQANLNKLNDKRTPVRNRLNGKRTEEYSEPLPALVEKSGVGENIGFFLGWTFFGSIAAVILLLFIEKYLSPVWQIMIMSFSPVFAIVLIAVNGIKADNTNRERMEKYNDRKEQYENDKKKEIVELERELQPLSGKITELEKVLNSTLELLRSYYSLGFLYPKYQNADAVIHILEYLQSERCKELTGPFGAYNLYESESRLDTIIHEVKSLSQKIVSLGSVIQGMSFRLNDLSYNMQNNLRSIQDTINLQNSAINNLGSSMSAVNGNLADMNKLSQVYNDQAVRLMEYQNFAIKQKRLEEGHWT